MNNLAIVRALTGYSEVFLFSNIFQSSEYQSINQSFLFCGFLHCRLAVFFLLSFRFLKGGHYHFIKCYCFRAMHAKLVFEVETSLNIKLSIFEF